MGRRVEIIALKQALGFYLEFILLWFLWLPLPKEMKHLHAFNFIV